MAGADIKEFAKLTSGKTQRGPGLLPVLLKIEDSKKPVVVAIHGQALGGGLELAMSGNYRVASASAQVGAAGGEAGNYSGRWRNAAVAEARGVAAAVAMCTDGKPVTAAEALKLGIVDRIVEGDLLEGAVAFAREVAARPGPKTRARNEKLGAAADNAMLFNDARDAARKSFAG